MQRPMFEAPRSLAPFTLTLTLGLAACGGGEGGSDAEASPAGGGGMSLGTPSAVFPEDFGTVQAVRELPDGRVMVADPLGSALYVVDLDAGTRETLGTEGQGPGEYRQPDTVWPIGGDSTLLVDLGNARFMTLDSDFAFGETSPLSTGDPRSGLVVALPQGVDANGNVYARSMGGGMGGELPDSGAILRVGRGDFSVDTLAMYKLQERTLSESGGPDNRSVSIQQIPLSPEDSWGVGADGAIVVARSSDYHVEWIAPDGSMTAGGPVAYDPVSIGSAEKEEWLASRGQQGGGIGISVSINDTGAMQTSFRRGGMRMGGREEPSIDDYEWPATKPPFYDGRIVVDPLGRAWVRRHVEAGADATYDLFDRSAERVATYSLPNNKRVVGFGDGSVYVVAFDEFDLTYLERYALPG
jgi:hypothetical protein